MHILHRPFISNKTRESDILSCHTKIQIMHKTTLGRKPKKKIYHRVHELDRAMDLHKKPSLILQLKSIIQSQKTGSLLLRDLEKEVGFVQKWNHMTVIEKYPTIFRVVGGQADRSPPAVALTEKAKKIAALESEARVEMEPILVRNLRKLLMMSVDCRLPLGTIDSISNELGLPHDFKNSVISKYPECFKLSELNGREYLHLENWDSSLAVTAREERLALQGGVMREAKRVRISKDGNFLGPYAFQLKFPAGFRPNVSYLEELERLALQGGVMREAKRVRISKDGNFLGPYAFQLKFPAGFRPNVSYLEELERWQKLEFPSPYLNARTFEAADPKARKRAVAVLHELLSLTMEKRLTSAQLDAFHSEYRLPARLLLCLIKHHGIFYITNKGVKSTVILKEAYDGSKLIFRCPMMDFRDKFLALIGRKEDNRSCVEMG